MKKLYNLFLTTFFIIASACMVFAQPNRGTIKGKVLTSDNKPADNVSVSLKGTKYGTITNENGEYSFKAAPGTYTLHISSIGTQSSETSVEVKANQVITVPVVSINTSSNALNDVTISATNNRFTRKASVDASKIPLAPLENAQVYSTITNELIKEQQVLSVDDAVRNAPGIQKLWDATGRAGDGGAYYSQRGFVTQARLRNGIAGLVTSGIDAANIERIEVIKGPSGTLYGSNLTSFGGLINRVTKKPYESFGAEVSHTVGNYELSRTAVDVNTPLNPSKTVLFRLNTAYQYEGSFQNYGFNRSYLAAPTLAIKPNSRLSILLEAELFYGRSAARPFFFFLSTPRQMGISNANQANIDYKQAYVNDDITQRTRSSNYYAQVNYKISDKFTSQTLFSTSNSYSNGASPYFYLAADSVVAPQPGGVYSQGQNNYILRYDQSTRNSKLNAIQIQENINGDFNIGTLRNRLVIGLDYQYQNSNQLFFSNFYGSAPRNSPTYDYGSFNKILVDQTNNANPLTVDNTYPYIYKTNTYSAYASDVINITEQLFASAGVRVDHYRNGGNYRTDGVLTSPSYNQTAVSPKFGLVFQPLKDQLSLFANYQNGFVNPGYFLNTTGSTVRADIQNANQIEGGVKMALFNGKLNGTISYYNIKLTNVLRGAVGTTLAGAQIQDGTQRSRGFEAEVVANPVSGVNIVAGFSYNDSKYTKADADVLNLRPNTAGSPYLANWYVSYRLPQSAVKGLGVGLGGNYASENKVINSVSQGTFSLPSYTVLNANVFIDRIRYRFGLAANNFTNEHYFTGYTTINPQKLRQFILTASYKF
ncbi:TonB-dependent receptor [Mucilaginibacter sp. Bleaf8]|uniref:TonB-dependent receptor n=1 Tax=Mucilaginibacter sp. Bleaf8 TaxID=2834430 RepID=UPI001BCCD5A6|nr:TonB-dependent receptor [Mucilaginibacter sp. Bleaf8]MBS7566538.1 TonB-dependent receptor [Mucilaginibacter sp. Bleaf8]